MIDVDVLQQSIEVNPAINALMFCRLNGIKNFFTNILSFILKLFIKLIKQSPSFIIRLFDKKVRKLCVDVITCDVFAVKTHLSIFFFTYKSNIMRET